VEELVEAAVADLGLAPVDGKQLADAWLHAAELPQKLIRAIVDPDGFPDRFNCSPVNFPWLGIGTIHL